MRLNSKKQKAFRKDFELPFTGLKEGVHSFEFSLDQTFFATLFEGLDTFENPRQIESGEAQLTLILEKKPNFMHLKLHIEGNVILPCDNCLELVSSEIDIRQQLYITNRTVDVDDDNYMVLDESAHSIDILPLIYENIHLAIPIRNVHEEGGCNEEMLGYLSNEPEASEDEEIDPRWAALKELKKKNK